eukprot:scaffold5715_cov166-Amphora_coffeaeformis.AAC.3
MDMGLPSLVLEWCSPCWVFSKQFTVQGWISTWSGRIVILVRAGMVLYAFCVQTLQHGATRVKLASLEWQTCVMMIASDRSGTTSIETLAALIADGSTAEGAENRILVVDTRSSLDYIHGHIQDALNVPYDLTAQDGKPLYTNGRDKVSTTASDKMADSWMTHLLVNQLVNDFVSTYQDSTIIFYGDDRASDAVQIAQKIGYTHVSILQSSNYEEWLFKHPGMTEMYAPGVVSMDELSGSFVVSGLVNNVNYENVSIRATHHGITYKGGALSRNSLIWANIPPLPNLIQRQQQHLAETLQLWVWNLGSEGRAIPTCSGIQDAFTAIMHVSAASPVMPKQMRIPGLTMEVSMILSIFRTTTVIIMPAGIMHKPTGCRGPVKKYSSG